jgi:ketosteroid isomerase-like protein
MKTILMIIFETVFISTLVYCQAGQQEPSGLQGSHAGHLPLSRRVQPQTKQGTEREIVAKTISSVIGWAKEKNLDLFYSVICHDTDYVSVSPSKRVVKRFEDVKQSVPFWMSPDFKYVRHELKDLRIRFSRGGDVAWFYCILDDINTYKGEPASWENARWTGVVEKRGGKWVVVQQHFSFAADK